jgi:hypothetical protein
MRGTLVCGVNDSEAGRSALELAVELSERLGLRLVLAYVRDGYGAGGDRDGAESMMTAAVRERAEQALAQLGDDYGVAESADRRSGVGDAASSRARRRCLF